MSSAQEEFNQILQNSKEKASAHPEDRDSSASSDNEAEEDHQDLPSDPEDYNNDMRSRNTSYQVPNTVFDANTGPKGVIADAQAFERARKQSFRSTLGGGGHSRSSSKGVSDDTTPLNNNSPPRGSGAKDKDDEESRFMRKWRESRMQQLQSFSLRRSSPRRKVYGSVDTVDAAGYLDAVEKVTSDTVVVVCIYDPDSSASGIVEDCLNNIARRNTSTHFIKLHHEISEMENIQAPALLAYRGGDVFATIVEIFGQIPKGRACSAESLEDLLKLHRIL